MLVTTSEVIIAQENIEGTHNFKIVTILTVTTALHSIFNIMS